MDVAAAVLALVATVTLVAGLARRRNLSAPLLLTVVGVARTAATCRSCHRSASNASWSSSGCSRPGVCQAIRGSLVAFKANRGAIGMLSGSGSLAEDLCSVRAAAGAG